MCSNYSLRKKLIYVFGIISSSSALLESCTWNFNLDQLHRHQKGIACDKRDPVEFTDISTDLMNRSLTPSSSSAVSITAQHLYHSSKPSIAIASSRTTAISSNEMIANVTLTLPLMFMINDTLQKRIL
mmetsp:Transcript_35838/g.83517  ORF Transcript_35838/g.83517 Transcript_35838/m.83517 type:complete len:128 (-) Transcript_35838:3245-3628(-)